WRRRAFSHVLSLHLLSRTPWREPLSRGVPGREAPRIRRASRPAVGDLQRLPALRPEPGRGAVGGVRAVRTSLPQCTAAGDYGSDRDGRPARGNGARADRSAAEAGVRRLALRQAADEAAAQSPPGLLAARHGTPGCERHGAGARRAGGTARSVDQLSE